MDYSSGADTGDYEIHYTRAPGANEHGALVNGGTVVEAIEMGDLDSYTFAAFQGDTIQLQMTDLGGRGLDPQMNVYGPEGSLLTWQWDSTVAVIQLTAPVSGVYTLVVMDYNPGVDTGLYDIFYTRQ